MKTLMIAAMMAGVAASASAKIASTTTDWGTHSTVEYGSDEFVLEHGSFTDYYTFSLAGTSSLTDVAFTLDLGKIFNIKDGDLQLWEGTVGGKSTEVGDFAFNGLKGTEGNFADLSTGDYFYVVTGKVSGLAGGAYAFTSSLTSAVPEPTSLALLAAGLGVIGFVGRRRRLDKRA